MLSGAIHKVSDSGYLDLLSAFVFYVTTGGLHPSYRTPVGLHPPYRSVALGREWWVSPTLRAVVQRRCYLIVACVEPCRKLGRGLRPRSTAGTGSEPVFAADDQAAGPPV